MTEAAGDIDVGLALSGGGSRAAAFHCGTLRALGELDLVRRVKVVSSVSGGSVFAASWLAAKARGLDDGRFLTWIHGVLRRGFIRPALLHPKAITLLWRSRTRLIADTFDRLLFHGLDWKDLPASPVLCLNTTVLNHARAGRFSQDGYSGAGVGELTKDGYPVVPVDGVTIGFATAASAAFPFGLPPLRITAARFKAAFSKPLVGHDKLVLTDGGILENLGIERLLQSRKFGAKHVVVSDAGARDLGWRPSLFGWLKGTAIYALSAEQLDRLLSLMNNKQNASMRQLLFARVFHEAGDEDRRVLFVRLEHDWASLLRGLPAARLAKYGLDDRSPPDAIEAAVTADGADLTRAKDLYLRMGGDAAVVAANAVKTSFVGLDTATLDLLDLHARWQVHALVALHGAPP